MSQHVGCRLRHVADLPQNRALPPSGRCSASLCWGFRCCRCRLLLQLLRRRYCRLCLCASRRQGSRGLARDGHLDRRGREQGRWGTRFVAAASAPSGSVCVCAGLGTPPGHPAKTARCRARQWPADPPPHLLHLLHHLLRLLVVLGSRPLSLLRSGSLVAAKGGASASGRYGAGQIKGWCCAAAGTPGQRRPAACKTAPLLASPCATATGSLTGGAAGARWACAGRCHPGRRWSAAPAGCLARWPVSPQTRLPACWRGAGGGPVLPLRLC